MPSSSSLSISNFYGKTRFVIMALCGVCLTMIVANSIAFNFTVICMHKAGTNHSSAKETMFTASEQGWLFTGVPIGRVFGSSVVSHNILWVGFRKTFASYGMLSVSAIILVPIVVHYAGAIGLFVLQLILGFSLGSVWPAYGAITYAWSPLDNYGLFLSLLNGVYTYGPIFVMPLAGALCSNELLGWPSVYYVLGTASLLFILLFIAFYRDSPREQRFVSAAELAVIEKDKELDKTQSKGHKVAYREILCDIVIWSQIICYVAANTTYLIFLMYIPTYLNKALNVPVSQTGIFAATIFIVGLIARLIAGPLIDRLHQISQKSRVILFSSAQYLAVLSFAVIVLLPKYGIVNLALIQASLGTYAASNSFYVTGIMKSTQLVCCQFSHIIFTMQTLLTSILFLAIPPLISLQAPNNTIDEWAPIYIVCAAAIAIGVTLFIMTVQVTPRSWTMGRKESNVEEDSNLKMALQKDRSTVSVTVT